MIWQEHFVRGGGTRGVSGQGVWCLVPDAWYMNHAKPISEGLLLDIAEAGIADLVDRAVPEDLEEWFVVYSDYRIVQFKHNNFF